MLLIRDEQLSTEEASERVGRPKDFVSSSKSYHKDLHAAECKRLGLPEDFELNRVQSRNARKRLRAALLLMACDGYSAAGASVKVGKSTAFLCDWRHRRPEIVASECQSLGIPNPPPIGSKGPPRGFVQPAVRESILRAAEVRANGGSIREAARRQDLNEGQMDARIRRHFDTVWKPACEKLGVDPNGHLPPPPPWIPRAAAMLASGLSQAEAERRLELSHGAISRLKDGPHASYFETEYKKADQFLGTPENVVQKATLLSKETWKPLRHAKRRPHKGSPELRERRKKWMREVRGKLKRGWYHRADAIPPAPYTHGPLRGTKQQLGACLGSKASGRGGHAGELLESKAKKGIIWVRRLGRQTFEAFFRVDKDFAEANAKILACRRQ